MSRRAGARAPLAPEAAATPPARARRLFVYQDGEIQPEEANGPIAALLAERARLLWLDILRPHAEDYQLLQQEFAWHPLLFAELRRPTQRPKLRVFGTVALIAFAAAKNTGRVRVQQLRVVAGPNYLVTFHEEEIPELDEALRRWRQNEAMVGTSSSGVMLASLLESIVDGYLPVLDSLAHRIERVEDRVFHARQVHNLHDLLAVRKDILRLRRTVGPCRDVVLQLFRHDLAGFGPETRLFLQDLYDHLQRALDTLDALHDIAISVADLALTIVSNNLNTVMKRLTAYATILMSVTLLTGIYGMNFELMPLLHEPYGFPLMLAAMGLIAAMLGWLFRRFDWL
jgi:magnesium transporter